MMATTTTRLGLRKPGGTDDITVATDLDGNYDLIDSALDRYCTSGTRPSSTYQGMQAYETDTHNRLIRNGSNWDHPSIPNVSTTSSILQPYDGQLIWHTGEKRLYVYHGGSSSWRHITAYARYALTGAATRALAANADTVMQWPTTVASDPRIVAHSAGGNDYFTVEPGDYTISVSLRTSANATMVAYLCAGSTTPTESNAFKGSSGSLNVVGVTDDIQFTATENVSALVWSNTALNAISYGSGTYPMTSISFMRHA